MPVQHLDRSAARRRRALAPLWTWLSRCAHEGCDERPVRLGRCDQHAPGYDPGPDEYWG